MKSKRMTVSISIATAILAIVVFAWYFISNYFDYIELKEIGQAYTKVFWTNFNVNSITKAVIFIIVFLIFYFNFYIIRRNLISIDLSFSYLKSNSPSVIISAIISLFMCRYAGSMIADKFLPFLNSEWFNLGDPIYHADVGYYVFQRPFYVSLIDTLSTLSVLLIVLTAISYFVLYAKFDFYDMKNIFKNKSIIVHTLSTIIILFAVRAAAYKYIAEDILYSGNKEFTGANYVDIMVWIPYYKIIPILLILIVVAAIILVMNAKYRAAVLTVAIYPLTLVAVMIAASAVEALMVAPNEFAVEAPYLENNIKFTRAAYDLERVQDKQFAVKNDLDGNKIMNNSATINNIRVTDFEQTIKAANQLQSIKNYYSFSNADIVPYTLQDRLMAVTIAAREIDKTKLDDSAKNYINMRMKYTHGMGVVMNSVSNTTAEGQPLFVVKDIPPRSIDGTPTITQPRIYYGEHNNDYVIVNTKDKELDDIDQQGYSYKGFGGVQLNLLQRVLYACKLGDFKLLVSSQVNSNSKLLINTNVVERVRKIAPFITFDSDAGILIDGEGRLKWVVDGYTTTNAFPYAQYHGDYNYIRNSVKAVVDAYDGTVTLYVINNSDPIIRSYQRIYPTLFAKGSYPADLAEHIKYPEKLFKTQVDILKKYHITDTAAFFQKRGMWAVAKQKYEGEKTKELDPYYMITKLDGEEKEEFILMIPMTLVNKDNMVSWFAVRCSKEHYGEMIIYNFPSGENIYGPYQIETRIDNDPVISQELTLWSAGGSSVIRGNLLVIPIDNNLLYVEPIYITSGKDESTLPEIKRVIVAYGDKIVSKPSISEAISALFGVNTPDAQLQDETIQNLLQKAIDSYESVRGYASKNDWENYGKAMKQLEDAIEGLKQRKDDFVTTQ